jgi:hypothetical protein
MRKPVRPAIRAIENVLYPLIGGAGDALMAFCALDLYGD